MFTPYESENEIINLAQIVSLNISDPTMVIARFSNGDVREMSEKESAAFLAWYAQATGKSRIAKIQ